MYRVYKGFPGKPPGNNCTCPHVFVDKVYFPAQMANSKARALVAPTNDKTFIIQKNGVQIATIEFVAANPVPTFANMASAVSFNIDDYMTIVAPAVSDPTLEGIGITLFGERYL